jgi:radical SAM superfamily enzyme YgiQ (UPF0313 family)
VSVVTPRLLRVVLVKPSKYGRDGAVERFRRGFMPNGTLYHLASLTPGRVDGRPVAVETVDEYVETDLDYLRLLHAEPEVDTVLGLVGVQSHQLHRALDLAAYARAHGIGHVVLGGPHAMTADTDAFGDRGVSVALAEAERVWSAILADAAAGGLRPAYGVGARFAERLPGTVVVPPSETRLRRYAVQMLGVYPARGCPYRCTFCSVIQVAGRRIRSEPVDAVLTTLRAARAAGVLLVMFTSDNFNKYPEATELLEAMIAERLDLPFFVQCDVQVVRQPRFVELLARAGCYQMFVGVESFDRAALVDVKKNQNHPEAYGELVRLCAEHGIGSHLSNILGFPSETAASIRERVDLLRALRPDLASFYVLTPFPGTEHYDALMAAGLVTEPNLDRFDATCPTWRHPHLAATELEALLAHAYRRFYALPDAAAKSLAWAWRKRGSQNVLLKIAVAAYSVLSRYAVARGMHPMAGGVGRVVLDGARDYAALRRAAYGFALAPLPRSLRAGTAAERAAAQVAR